LAAAAAKVVEKARARQNMRNTKNIDIDENVYLLLMNWATWTKTSTFYNARKMMENFDINKKVAQSSGELTRHLIF
jgi:hypothetical protein